MFNELFGFFLISSEDIRPRVIQQNCEIPIQRGCKQSMKIYDVSSQFALGSFFLFHRAPLHNCSLQSGSGIYGLDGYVRN